MFLGIDSFKIFLLVTFFANKPAYQVACELKGVVMTETTKLLKFHISKWGKTNNLHKGKTHKIKKTYYS